MSVPTSVMTTEEMLALPENGVERALIRGELREAPMTRRNRRHSAATSRIAYLLERWLEGQPRPRGQVLAGEAGFRIRRNPDTSVGIDVAYISADLAARAPDSAFLIDGPPTLAVEILSPSDRYEDVTDKIEEYLSAQVPLIWLVDPVFQTVQVHRPGQAPELYNIQQSLTGGPQLPGFTVAVADIFAD